MTDLRPLVRDSVDLDGGGGTTCTFIYSWGSLAVGTHDYIVNVLGQRREGQRPGHAADRR